MYSNGIVTLTTDFGLSDPYAGIMRGAVLSTNPRATVVDITHGIPAHDIMTAAFTFANAYGFFPAGTVHAAVVDPGVGGVRKNIAVMTDRYFFVGPDNGILSIALAREGTVGIREIANPAFIRDIISNTFHGRDVFAPCAGMLSAGSAFENIGPLLTDYRKLTYPQPVIERDTLTGEVLVIDSFGNMVTNITETQFHTFIGSRSFEVYFASERFTRLASNYEEVPAGKPLAIIGSTGHLELSMSSGNAAEYFMSAAGSVISVRRS